MFRVLYDLQRSSPPRNANLETEREFPPYHAKQVMGGRKRAVTPSLAHGDQKKTHCFKNAGAFWGGLLRALLNLFSTPSGALHHKNYIPNCERHTA